MSWLGRLTLILLMWKIRWAPNNASKWEMGFNSAFKGLITSLSPRRPGFNPRPVHVGFVEDKVAPKQISLRVLRVFPLSVQFHCCTMLIHSSITNATYSQISTAYLMNTKSSILMVSCHLILGLSSNTFIRSFLHKNLHYNLIIPSRLHVRAILS
jgi:hypothetical protein